MISKVKKNRKNASEKMLRILTTIEHKTVNLVKVLNSTSHPVCAELSGKRVCAVSQAGRAAGFLADLSVVLSHSSLELV